VTKVRELALWFAVAVGMTTFAAWFYGCKLTEHELAAGLCAAACGVLLAVLPIRQGARRSR
jgi:hypothetical protein